ncbi:type VII secretion protein EccB [Streptomyces sp. AM 2-1-1]|uniref:type VII secretion protein EccB n=1 Tax=Streptomyces sp. AM 2-1-1 TaxID=3028709 RepID=UPI0023B99321|nr:type VII secretion protein EccB [Streptomyces sp. AM 2-1-1]WEH43412.1 type VII secretion protein EccB [Streptomyces sp. AM 2-1-1]
MQSKRDQVQAHMFVMQRLASGMLRADPDAPESPSGRTNRGVAIGLVVAVLVCAGTFVIGLIKPGGSDSWKTAGDLIVDKGTGARYLYLEGRLHPVRNYASARLLGGKDLGTTTVGSSSLDGTPFGSPVGVPGAPDTLPPASGLDTGSWQVCSGLAATPSGEVSGTTALAIGATAEGGALGAGQAVLLAGPDRSRYLLWQGSRLRLDAEAGAADALGYGSAVPRPVTAAFLDALPAGPDLAPPDVPGRGSPGPALGNGSTRLGQLFRVDVPGTAPRYHLLTAKGLVPLTETGAALVLGDPQTRTQAYAGRAPTARPLGSDVLGRHLAPATDALAALPAAPPRLVDIPRDSVACVGVDGTPGRTRVSAAVLPGAVLGPAVQPAPEARPSCLAVDTVSVAPGRGALVRAVSSGGAALGDTTYVVDGTGVKYRVGSSTALEALGYAGATARTLPAMLLAMLPTGPDLTPEAAERGAAEVSAGQCSTVPPARR